MTQPGYTEKAEIRGNPQTQHMEILTPPFSYPLNRRAFVIAAGAVDPRLWLFRQADDERLGFGPYRQGVGHAHASPWP